jgi:hypothetical protein
MNNCNKNSTAKRYKLTKEQEEVYEWVKNQNINTDDNTLCYWVKAYSLKRLKEVINFANARRNSGQEIQNIGGWIHRFLKSGQIVVNDTCKLNHAFAMEFMESKVWMDLKIFEKYIRDEVTGDDLSLTMPIDDFRRSLEALYQKSLLYK